MAISRIKLPCVPNKGGVTTMCTLSSGTSTDHLDMTSQLLLHQQDLFDIPSLESRRRHEELYNK